MALDEKNKTTCWADATQLELELAQQIDTFKDMGTQRSCSPWLQEDPSPPGSQCQT